MDWEQRYKDVKNNPPKFNKQKPTTQQWINKILHLKLTRRIKKKRAQHRKRQKNPVTEENQIARINAAKARKLLKPTIKTTYPTVQSREEMKRMEISAQAEIHIQPPVSSPSIPRFTSRNPLGLPALETQTSETAELTATNLTKTKKLSRNCKTRQWIAKQRHR